MAATFNLNQLPLEYIMAMCIIAIGLGIYGFITIRNLKVPRTGSYTHNEYNDKMLIGLFNIALSVVFIGGMFVAIN
ncbi:hypothetical protein GCM10023149_50730 [Mucilaginibacter gynuensis]|uniref:Uncharacterized protein n=1 Tax=Mucilaginibacter gynuensis TaxID=1302236 RepID=A0ABP8HIY7_9SPHI